MVLTNSPVLVSCFTGYYVLLRSLRSESVPSIEKVAGDGRNTKNRDTLLRYRKNPAASTTGFS
ncbi:MAG: hypothetical protein PUH02_00315 [bacterium]|nr:hypothetical protein [bacterium]